ncbi:hypothetical protein BJF82_15920 [Kytococcus sp. CUA-901]|nr:hypothetical protein BJF82_15920 [Kytococcus sp. CUA-901]
MHFDGAQVPGDQGVTAHIADVNSRILDLARAQSRDIGERLESAGVEVVQGAGSLLPDGRVLIVEGVDEVESGEEPAPHDDDCGDAHTRREVEADLVLVSTGARPRVLDSAQPDGERILTWQQIWDLEEPARAPGGDRVRRHRRRAGARLPRARVPGHADLLARPGAAGGRTPTRPTSWRRSSGAGG